MVALTPTQRLSEEQRQMFSQLQLPKSNCFHFCRPRQDGRGKSRHACVALQTSAPSGHAERTRPAPASATLLSASAPLRYTPAAPARRLHAGLRFRIPSTRASVRRGVCWGHAAACPQCSCMSAGHPIGGPARGGRGCWPAGCDSQIAKRENGCSSATRCATPANHGRSEELAARGRQGVGSICELLRPPPPNGPRGGVGRCAPAVALGRCAAVASGEKSNQPPGDLTASRSLSAAERDSRRAAADASPWAVGRRPGCFSSPEEGSGASPPVGLSPPESVAFLTPRGFDALARTRRERDTQSFIWELHKSESHGTAFQGPRTSTAYLAE